MAETVSVPQSKYLNDFGILICRLASFRHVGFSTPNCSTKNCLSAILIATNPYTGFFAVFIADEKVKDFRRSIGIDQCESAMYSLLPSPPAVQENNKPGKRKKSIQHKTVSP